MSEDRMRTADVNRLLEVLVSLSSTDDAYSFLQDLCTVREIQDMSQRLSVAQLLAEGVPYTRIQTETGASATTISRVSKCLNYGSGGYRSVLGLKDEA